MMVERGTAQEARRKGGSGEGRIDRTKKEGQDERILGRRDRSGGKDKKEKVQNES